jgi:hypothetical protein
MEVSKEKAAKLVGLAGTMLATFWLELTMTAQLLE